MAPVWCVCPRMRLTILLSSRRFNIEKKKKIQHAHGFNVVWSVPIQPRGKLLGERKTADHGNTGSSLGTVRLNFHRLASAGPYLRFGQQAVDALTV